MPETWCSAEQYMPKELTHWILAERALDGLDADNRLRGVIGSHRAAYLGGAVLPDTLLHLFRGPHARAALSLGHRFHDTRGNSYAPLILAESNFPNGMPDDLRACLLGVICHMQADMVFHPFVYALGGTGDMGRHYRLETAIDLHLLRKGAVPPARRFAELVTLHTRAVFIQSAGLLFDPEQTLPLEALEQALSLHCRLQALYDRTIGKIAAAILGTLLGSPFREQRQLFYPFSSSAPEYVRSLEAAGQWLHPVTGATSKATIDDLADETVRRTIALFRRIADHESLAAVLTDPPGTNLLTGLSGVGKSDMIHSSQSPQRGS
jgi:hypothetical protein